MGCFHEGGAAVFFCICKDTGYETVNFVQINFVAFTGKNNINNPLPARQAQGPRIIFPTVDLHDPLLDNDK